MFALRSLLRSEKICSDIIGNSPTFTPVDSITVKTKEFRKNNSIILRHPLTTPLSIYVGYILLTTKIIGWRGGSEQMAGYKDFLKIDD